MRRRGEEGRVNIALPVACPQSIIPRTLLWILYGNTVRLTNTESFQNELRSTVSESNLYYEGEGCTNIMPLGTAIKCCQALVAIGYKRRTVLLYYLNPKADNELF